MARKKSSAARKRSKNQAVRKTELTLDAKLDITGVVMILIGGLTLFSMFSSTQSAYLIGWNNILELVFGWGMYIFPIGALLIGGWLILRKFENFPNLSIERTLGMILIFLLFLTSAHYFSFPEDDAIFNIEPGQFGGGYLGAAMLYLLQPWLGVGGAAVVLLAWFFLSLAVTLDISVLELFRKMSFLTGGLRFIGRGLRSGWLAIWRRLIKPRERNQESFAVGSESQQQVQTTSQQASQVPPADQVEVQPHEWVLPVIEEILDVGTVVPINEEHDRQRADVIEETLKAFNAPGLVVEINRGPTITQFGVEPHFIEMRGQRRRVRVNKIASLADDLALALAATRVRIQAPVPGKGFVGIEVPNGEIALVSLRDGISNKAFHNLEGKPLRFFLGQDVSGNAVAADLAAMPHLLVAGTTGSGKSVCVNAIIASLLIHNTPDQLRFIMVDPKRVELTGYDGVPHLLAPVVVELDRVVGALQWVTREMDQRYEKFSDVGARNLLDFNQRMTTSGGRELPYLVVIIDELADLMMLAPEDTERAVTRMAQLARATGIHMIISTQRPSVNVVTGLIKANFPARIAFATASGTDSRVILDSPGAERLLGRGDMLFHAPDAPAAVRLQGAFVSDFELIRLVQYWRRQSGYVAPTSVAMASGGHPDGIPKNIPLRQIEFWGEMKEDEDKDSDPLYAEAVDLIRRQGRASISMLQRRLRIGYTRAARLIDKMESKGIIGEATGGSLPREVLDYGPAAPPKDD
jgi:S-DNA-T family DNA segregation ATPase FtsK/SpoIIIE